MNNNLKKLEFDKILNILSGYCKTYIGKNFATELRAAYTAAGRKLMEEKPETIDPKALGKVGMAAVTELVKGRMKVCGCDGKAE